MSHLRGALILYILAAATAKTWDKEFWKQNDADELKVALRKPNTNLAKNLVLGIGDGMGVTTTTATRIYRGQLNPNLLGEEALLSWDKFPHVGMSKTYCTDMTTTDSAASATAYHCGVKTKYEMVGVDDTAQRNVCSTVANAKVESVLRIAANEGKSVGIVTTDALVGASPSAAYAHAALRNWRADYEMPKDAQGVCKDIARQLIEDNADIKVLLGGGRKYFLPNNQSDPEYPAMSGRRTDGKDLIKLWKEYQGTLGRKARYVTDMTGFNQATADNTDYLLGIFEPARMQEETTRRINKTEPSLAEMVEKAIQILSKNPKGFYLFIEGANIDIGHHGSRARMALEEGLAFDDAVGKVMSMTSSDDTLVVVSADHSHAFAFGGYSFRGTSILSIANNTYYNDKDKTGNHYSVLAYANGPGYVKEADRVNLTDEYFKKDRVYQSAFPLTYETHGGEDVEIFASGPMSHLFTGVHEQTFIATGMKYAACIGENKDHCPSPSSGSAVNKPLHYAYLILLAIVIILVVSYQPQVKMSK